MFSDVWSENAALFKRLMEFTQIHQDYTMALNLDHSLATHTQTQALRVSGRLFYLLLLTVNTSIKLHIQMFMWQCVRTITIRWKTVQCLELERSECELKCTELKYLKCICTPKIFLICERDTV